MARRPRHPRGGGQARVLPRHAPQLRAQKPRGGHLARRDAHAPRAEEDLTEHQGDRRRAEQGGFRGHQARGRARRTRRGAEAARLDDDARGGGELGTQARGARRAAPPEPRRAPGRWLEGGRGGRSSCPRAQTREEPAGRRRGRRRLEAHLRPIRPRRREHDRLRLGSPGSQRRQQELRASLHLRQERPGQNPPSARYPELHSPERPVAHLRLQGRVVVHQRLRQRVALGEKVRRRRAAPELRRHRRAHRRRRPGAHRQGRHHQLLFRHLQHAARERQMGRARGRPHPRRARHGQRRLR